MAVFAGLSEKLNHIFSKMTKRGKLTELEIKQAMRANTKRATTIFKPVFFVSFISVPP